MDKHWFVFYTKSRHEKKVKDLLERNSFEVFLPLQKVMRQWTDRKKKVEVPLFNSYIFVNCFEYEINSVLQIHGISWAIRHNGKPATLRPDELRLIQRFMESGLFVETSSMDEFEVGDRAEVIDGPLKGMKGALTGTANSLKLSVAIEGINQVMKVELANAVLKKLTD